jgi:hypothetical protein
VFSDTQCPPQVAAYLTRTHLDRNWVPLGPRPAHSNAIVQDHKLTKVKRDLREARRQIRELVQLGAGKDLVKRKLQKAWGDQVEGMRADIACLVLGGVGVHLASFRNDDGELDFRTRKHGMSPHLARVIMGALELG